MQLYDGLDEVAGCVFVDTGTGDSYKRMPIREKDWGFLGQLDVGKVLGNDGNHKLLTDEEYEIIKREAETNQEQVAVDEAADLLGSFKQYEKVPLGRKPVSVIEGYLAEDLRRLNDEAERVGLGTARQRCIIRDNLEQLDEVFQDTERQQMRLSTHGRMVYAKKEAGHAVIYYQPEILLSEVEWVRSEYTRMTVSIH